MKFKEYSFWFSALLLIGISFIWPGDIPFINDEAQLIANALDANEQNRLAVLGLKGTAGVQYGPIPTWFYQVCLFFTKDLILISIVKNGVCTVLVFSILVVISRKIDYPQFPLLLLFVSPYLYFLNRSLWDNTFTIVFSALLYLQFILFSQKRSVFRFYLCLLLIVVLIHIELKSIFFYCRIFGSICALRIQVGPCQLEERPVGSRDSECPHISLHDARHIQCQFCPTL